MTLVGRIGQFLFFLGFLGLIIYFATNQAGMPRYLYCCFGVVLLIFGAYIMWTHRNPPEPSERFYTMRKMRENREKKRESIENRKYAETDVRRSKE